MIVKEFAKNEIAIARADEFVLDIAERMQRLHVGSLVVIETEGRKRIPIGIITDRDIVVNGLARYPNIIQKLRVEDVMTKDLVVAREDEPAEDVLRSMRARGIRRVPVVDFEGNLTGIVAFDDFIGAMSKEVSNLARLIDRERENEVSVA